MSVAFRPHKKPLAPTPSPAAAPGFQLSTTARAIRADREGGGTLRLTVTRDPKADKSATLALRVEGADVQSVTTIDASGASRVLRAENGAYKLTTAASLVLALGNLDVGEPVIVSADGAKAPAKVQLRVVGR